MLQIIVDADVDGSHGEIPVMTFVVTVAIAALARQPLIQSFR
jgi:DNA gyrase/topoisomerase IV subunit B